MDIQYLGHSSFRIRTKSAFIVTDPFDPKMVGIKFPSVKADIVTVSHDHKDHNNVDAVKDVKQVIGGPGEYEISDVSILGYPSFHDKKKGEERGKNTMYVFEADDIRFAHLGDLGHKLKSKKLGEMGDINILMIPVGGLFTIGPKKAAEIVRSLEPQITIPMHYKAKGLSSQFDKLAGIDDFLKEMNMVVERKPKLKISSSDLEEEQKIVVLERK